MEDLIELVLLFKNSKFKTTGLSNLLLQAGSQMERLFEGIAEGNLQSEEQLLEIFPEFNNSKTRIAALKYKLKERLLNGVLMLDFDEPAYRNRQKAYQECHRRYVAAMILMGKGLWNSGVDTLETLVRQSLRFEFTELNLDILRTLSRHYAFIEGKNKKYEEIEALLSTQEAIHDLERQVEHLYKELINFAAWHKADKKHLEHKAAHALQIVKPWMERCDTYWVQLLGRLIEIIWCDSLGQHQEAARLAEAGIAFFEQKKYESASAFQAFHNHLFAALSTLRDYERCTVLIERYGDRFEPGSFNWFKLQELQVLKAFQIAEYETARQLTANAMRHPNYAAQTPPVWEMWKFFEAFIAYLVTIGILDPGDFPVKFRMGRFVNEIQFYVSDKSGMNAHLLMLVLLFELLEQNTETCLPRIEALAKYRIRHLSDSASIRTNCFVRMLEQIPKANFLPEMVEQKTQALQEILKAHPFTAASQNYELEIIPYEALWRLVQHKHTRNGKIKMSNH